MAAIDPEAHSFRSFAPLLAALENGALLAELNNEMEDVVRDLQEAVDNGRKHKTSITVTVNLTAERGVVEVVADYKIKRPARARTRNLMFIHAGKYLSRQDDKQPDMLRAIPETSNSAPMRVAE